MKIGLVRHFKVKQAWPDRFWLSPADLQEWLDAYDQAEVETALTDLGGVNWGICFSSTIPRAVTTAKTIYKGPIHYTDKLREIPFRPKAGRKRLPLIAWAAAVKLAWTFNHKSQRKLIQSVRKRINELLDEVMKHPQHNVLLVSHAGLMMIMRQELIKRGFQGPRFRTPVNGRLYIFENSST